MICKIEGGIRVANDGNGGCGFFAPISDICTVKFYNAWWYFLRQVLGISVDELLRADFTPVHFVLDWSNAMDETASHCAVNRITGSGGNFWTERIIVGEFAIKLEGLAFVNEANDFAFARPAVFSFLTALNKGFVQVGGGRSIGRGFVRIENLDEMEYSIVGATPINPSRGHKCKKGHFAPWSTASFGGKCRCGAKIKPIWAKIPPGYCWLGGE